MHMYSRSMAVTFGSSVCKKGAGECTALASVVVDLKSFESVRTTFGVYRTHLQRPVVNLKTQGKCIYRKVCYPRFSQILECSMIFARSQAKLQW